MTKDSKAACKHDGFVASPVGIGDIGRKKWYKINPKCINCSKEYQNRVIEPLLEFVISYRL